MNSNSDPSVEKRYLLSDEQKKYYYANRHSDNKIDMMPTLLQFASDVDATKLADAFRQTIDAHPFFKANVQKIDNELFWRRQDDAEVRPVDICYVSKKELMNQLNGLIGKKEFHPDVTTDILYFAEIYVTNNNVYLLMVFHHIYYDGVTRNILIENILAAYNGLTLQRDKGRGIEEGNEEAVYRNSESFSRTENFYADLFRHYSNPLHLSLSPKRNESSDVVVKKTIFDRFCTLFETGCLSTFSSECRTKTHRAKTVDAYTDGSRLRNFCAAQKISPNILFLTGLCFAAQQLSGNDYLFFSTETAGRVGRELDNEAGLFIRCFPLGIKIDSSLSPLELLFSIKEQYYHILKNHTALTADTATEKFGFCNHFNYLYQADTYATKPALRQPAYNDITYLVTSKIFSATKIDFDCDVQIYNFDLLRCEGKDRYMINVRYDAGLYPKSLMKRFSVTIKNFIEGLY
ncbi:MAG: condensation domain-containing protein [Planctomycetaceae bacterium]|jgi:hypothetical protein|nr:condensation domain-containing protein [Planctomycetaceae bacterium]